VAWYFIAPGRPEVHDGEADPDPEGEVEATPVAV